MAKYLSALIGVAFIVVAASLTQAQTTSVAQQGATTKQPMTEGRGTTEVPKKSAKKAKKAKKKTARRGGMARPVPPGTDRPGGPSDQQSAKPRMDGR